MGGYTGQLSSQYPAPFCPWFLFPIEYSFYGLPSAADQPDIDQLVQTASQAIDTTCMRVDGDGNGSLVYTTYTQRLMSQSPGRNLMLLPMKPLVALQAQDITNLQGFASSASFQQQNLGIVSPYSLSGNFFYTGALQSINTLADGTPSAVIGASGRYTYSRRDQFPVNGDMGIINPLNTITLFGGPPPWIPIDMTNLDYDPRTGELWYAAGQYMERYAEIVIQYTSGYNPVAMPPTIKRVCAAAVKNLLAKGSGTTGMRSFNAGGGAANAQFQDDIIDDNLKVLLEPFISIRTY